MYPRPAGDSAGRFRYAMPQPFCNLLFNRHIPAAILLLLMVILLVARRNTLLPHLFTELPVNMGKPRSALRQGVVAEDIRHVVEQPGHGQHD